MGRVIALPSGGHLRVKTHYGTTTQLELVPDGISNETLRALCRPKARRSFTHTRSIKLRRSKLFIRLEGSLHRPPSQTQIDETIDQAVIKLSTYQEMHNRKPENSRRHRRRSSSKVDRRPRYTRMTTYPATQPTPLAARS